MNAREAYEKALWNKLPEKIRKEIERCIEKGLTKTEFYESSHPDLFDADILFEMNDILKNLGYIVEVRMIDLQIGDDIKLEISWKL